MLPPPAPTVAYFYSAALAWDDSAVDNPQAWLADVLARIAEHPASKLDELLPWNWRPENRAATKAA